MKSFFLFFICLAGFLFKGNAQVSKIIIDDQVGLINETNKNYLDQILANEKIIIDDFLDYEKRCEYTFFYLTKVEDEFVLSARDCNKVNKGQATFAPELKLASNEGIAKVLANEMVKLINGTSETSTSEGKSSIVYENHHDSRYYFAPTAYNLKKGQLYYNTLYFLIHDVQYGITDNFSMGLGTTIIGLPAYLTPKFSYKISENVSVMAGDLFVFGTYGLSFNINLAYAGITLGNPSKNVSISGGYLTSSEFNAGKGLLNISTMLSMSKYLYFVSENYFSSFDLNSTASRITGYSPDFYGNNYPDYEYKEFSTTTSFIGGFSGIRFISKRQDVQSIQVGFMYLIPLGESVPGDIKNGNWEYGGNSVPNLVVPGLSFTKKFGKVY